MLKPPRSVLSFRRQDNFQNNEQAKRFKNSRFYDATCRFGPQNIIIYSGKWPTLSLIMLSTYKSLWLPQIHKSDLLKQMLLSFEAV